MFRGLALAAAVLAVGAGAPPRPAAPSPASTEVVVRLSAKPLAHGGTAASIGMAQRRFEQALAAAVPAGQVRWRYRIVLDGMAVAVPRRAVSRLARLPGVAEVFAGASYPVADTGPAGGQIGAPQLWGPDLSTAGEGVKIGIIDVGIDRSSPFFDPAGFVMPPGYPMGQTAFTSAKVIVARSFPAPGQTSATARSPFNPNESHGTHVAGIAAGDAGTSALGALISGVAPRAYLGNYRALTVPTDSGVGDDGNSAEIVAAIEAAVADGMNVINLSIGEPEIEPTRDLVALALDGAAAAGVVPVVAAGNDNEEFGAGSISSPGSSASAITVAAVTTARDGAPNVIGSFSSAGPAPISLRLKPDVAAPGVGVLSSIPGGWGTLSGTSMATPHVAGAAALLLQRHPGWTVAQVKAALVETGDDAWLDSGHTVRATPTRAGGGVVDLARADTPLVFTSPSSVSLGLIHAGDEAAATVTLTDAGGGAGTWIVSLQATAPPGTGLTTQPTVEVPGSLTLSATAATTGKEGDATGYLVLQRGADTRRIPFWFRVTHPQLPAEHATPLREPGLHTGDTRGHPSLVSSYRYPQFAGNGAVRTLDGPEQVFRIVLARPVQNFGVAVVARGPGVRVEPRVVADADENRLTGYTALPIDVNPYLADLGSPVLAAGAVRPKAGTYDVVFDSRTAAGAGRFSFRFWINDTTPPSIRPEARHVRRGRPLVFTAVDRGAGVDAGSIVATIDGRSRTTTLSGDRVGIDTTGLAPGSHRVRLQVSDYQETRNMENVAAVLPNTRVLTLLVTITR